MARAREALIWKPARSIAESAEITQLRKPALLPSQKQTRMNSRGDGRHSWLWPITLSLEHRTSVDADARWQRCLAPDSVHWVSTPIQHQHEPGGFPTWIGIDTLPILHLRRPFPVGRSVSIPRQRPPTVYPAAFGIPISLFLFLGSRGKGSQQGLKILITQPEIIRIGGVRESFHH